LNKSIDIFWLNSRQKNILPVLVFYALLGFNARFTRYLSYLPRPSPVFLKKTGNREKREIKFPGKTGNGKKHREKRERETGKI